MNYHVPMKETLIETIEDPKNSSRCVFCSKKTNHWTNISERRVSEQLPVCFDCALVYLERDVPTLNFLRTQKFQRRPILKLLIWIWRVLCFLFWKTHQMYTQREKTKTMVVTRKVPVYTHREARRAVRDRRISAITNGFSAGAGITALRPIFKGWKIPK